MKRLYHKNETGSHVMGEDFMKYNNSQEICIQEIFLRHFKINTKKKKRQYRYLTKENIQMSK